MERVVFCAGDDTRFVVGGEPHRLRFVEFGILECREPCQSIVKRGREVFFCEVELVPREEIERFWHRAIDLGLWFSGRPLVPMFIVFFVGWGH